MMSSFYFFFFFGSLKVSGSLLAVSFSNLLLYSLAIFFLSLKYFTPIWASLIVSLNSSSVAPPPSSPLASGGSCQGYGTSGVYITITPLSTNRVRIQKNGSPGRTRTCNLTVNSRTLCQLSYRGEFLILYSNYKI